MVLILVKPPVLACHFSDAIKDWLVLLLWLSFSDPVFYSQRMGTLRSQAPVWVDTGILGSTAQQH